MSQESLHVVPHDGRWAVKCEGTERPRSTHDTQKEAIESANDFAKDGDMVVIHRADGTIRARTTYSDPDANSSPSNGPTRSRLSPSDVVSVGSRVSWGAVLAGTLVALAVYVALGLLALAIGVTTIDQVRSQTFAVGAAIVSVLCLLVSLFVGGFVASRTTVGEDKGEAVIYGLLVWATLFVILLMGGAGVGVGFGTWVLNAGQPASESIPVETLTEKLGLSEQQAERYSQVMEGARNQTRNINPQALAWWAFAGMMLSILASIGGSVAGAGPDLVLKRLHEKRVDVARVA